jgi:2'-5' RNA ligase
LFAQKDFRAPPFAVSQFSLIESRLDAHGPTYEHIADYVLSEKREPTTSQEQLADD